MVRVPNQTAVIRCIREHSSGILHQCRAASVSSAIRKGSRRSAFAGEPGSEFTYDRSSLRQSYRERQEDRAPGTQPRNSRQQSSPVSLVKNKADGNRITQAIQSGVKPRSRYGPSEKANATRYARRSESPDDLVERGGVSNYHRDAPGKQVGKKIVSPRQIDTKARNSIDKTTKDGHKRQNDPVSIPYTTPASEFLYGTSVVRAALTAQRRKCYKLYIYTGENRVDLAQDRELRLLAKDLGIEVRQVRGDWLRIMDKMSKGRPHNGYILEASPLPQLPIRSLDIVDEESSSIGLELDHQTREEEEINGNLAAIQCQTNARQPILLMLDGIQDPGNLGAVLRTAYFFGIDAVAIAKGSNAPIGPIAQKASSGAVENLKMLSVGDPLQFVKTSRDNGWRFYAAVAPGTRTRGQTYIDLDKLGSPAKGEPCVIMLGGEGEGLRSFLQAKADNLIGIEGHQTGRGGVDSLNVSVAAGVLCNAFCRLPQPDLTYQPRDPQRNMKEGNEQARLF